ncbi:hypothetical protein [Solimonas terrae]|uniref:Uncharacterized protein n=1 Tax=Solimonas terrae TaxID=1396819 RepID=A0A6M2BM21_9GAMM|nr:hypothetical protein [Solimonas terrae]NGY03444.1 hypothetical protein [Solimonas terrae]
MFATSSPFVRRYTAQARAVADAVRLGHFHPIAFDQAAAELMLKIARGGELPNAQQAARVVRRAAELSIPPKRLGAQATLELLAAADGFRNWPTLRASLEKSSKQQAPALPTQRSGSPEYTAFRRAVLQHRLHGSVDSPTALQLGNRRALASGGMSGADLLESLDVIGHGVKFSTLPASTAILIVELVSAAVEEHPALADQDAVGLDLALSLSDCLTPQGLYLYSGKAWAAGEDETTDISRMRRHIYEVVRGSVNDHLESVGSFFAMGPVAGSKHQPFSDLESLHAPVIDAVRAAFGTQQNRRYRSVATQTSLKWSQAKAVNSTTQP